MKKKVCKFLVKILIINKIKWINNFKIKMKKIIHQYLNFNKMIYKINNKIYKMIF